ncbi:MAG: sensor histidine kinase [Janibacter sp.]
MSEEPRPRRRRVGVAVRGAASGGRWLAARPDVLLALLAALFFIITWSTTDLTHRAPASLLPVLAVMTVAPLLVLVVRRSVTIAWAVGAVASLVWLVVPRVGDWPMPWPVTHFLVLLLTVLAVALYARLVEVAAVAVTTALFFLIVMTADLKAWAIGVVVIVAFGLLVRWLILSRRQLAEQEDEAEVERARRAVVEERSRIARELHDVVAHHMSMVVVQAQSAAYRLEDVSPAAREEFASIESSAREALNEVRGVLGVLREEGRAETAPQPGVADLPQLLEASRAAGMDLSWRLDLAEDRCPPGTGLVLHRILQEALANASRHAPGAPVGVTLIERSGSADLEVRSAKGVRPPSSGDVGGGNGIPGMRTRAEAVGGHLHAGADSDGGFRVHAVVPIAGRPSVSA